MRIERIHFTGNVVVASEELGALARPYEGRDVTPAELEELRQKVTRAYVDRGYVNSGALLPAALPRDGTLQIEVIEGRLEGLRVKGQGRLHESYLRWRLWPDPNAPFNVETLRERFQALLSDPMFDRVHAGVSPGSRVGSAFLDLEIVRAQPYQLALYANNYRPPSIGESAAGVSAWVRNLTGLGDVVDASAQVPLQGDHRPRGEISWRIPAGPWGTEIYGLASRGQSAVLEEPTRILDIESDVRTLEAGIVQRVLENSRHRLAFGIVSADRENTTTLGGVPFSFVLGEPDGITHVRSARFWQEYSFRWEGGATVLRSTFSRNRNNYEDVTGLPATMATPDHESCTWIGQAYAVTQFADRRAQASLKGTVQKTGQRLVPLDAFAVGGISSVRGFRENQLLRDEGGFVSAELELPVYARSQPLLSSALGVFADHGFGRNQGAATSRISSMGVLLKGRWERVRLEIAAALHRWRSADVPRTKGALQDRGVHVQLTYTAF